MIRNYFITAIRNLWRNKFFSVINIFGLSIAIGCCMLILLFAKDEMSFDRFHNKAQHTYRITSDFISTDGKVNKNGSTGMVQGPRFKANIPAIEEFVRIRSAGFNIKQGAEVFEQKALYADENFFSVFSFPLLYGNAQTALKDLHAVVLSERTAERYFGTANALGKTLMINTGDAFEPFVVSAIAKNAPLNSSIKTDMIVPMNLAEVLKPQGDPNWMNFYQNTFVVLKPGTDLKRTEAMLDRVFNKEGAEQIKFLAEKFGYKDKIIYHLQPLLQIHTGTDYPVGNGLSKAGSLLQSYILIVIAAIILLIACINFVNLTVARSLNRAKEIGVRKVIGGQRKQLILQFLGESFVLSFIAFVSAALIAYAALPLFNSLADKSLSFSYLLDGKLIMAYAGLYVISSLLAGFYPALVLSGFKPVDTLYGKARLGGKNYLSNGLIVFQFTLATFLIVATLVIYSQFNFMLNYDLGYDHSNVMRVSTASLDGNAFDVLKGELAGDPSIQMVTARQGGKWQTTAHVNGDKEQDFDVRCVSDNYFPFFKIPVISGRNFSKEFPSDSSLSVIVNESFVKAAGWKEPVGEIVDFFYNNEKYRVIGVVKDYHFDALSTKIMPQLFTIHPKYKYEAVYLKISPGKRTAAMKHAERTFKKLYPMQPYQYEFEDDAIENNYKSERKAKQVITFSALLAVLISCIGLFGLSALSAEKRAKEIGIRKVLGASVTAITGKLSADFLKLVILAICIAMPAAWLAGNKFLDNYPYRIDLNIILFALAACAVLCLALFTISYQAIKAAMASPVKNLKASI